VAELCGDLGHRDTAADLHACVAVPQVVNLDETSSGLRSAHHAPGLGAKANGFLGR
jgi:hypothetical protein